MSLKRNPRLLTAAVVHRTTRYDLERLVRDDNPFMPGVGPVPFPFRCFVCGCDLGGRTKIILTPRREQEYTMGPQCAPSWVTYRDPTCVRCDRGVDW